MAEQPLSPTKTQEIESQSRASAYQQQTTGQQVMLEEREQGLAEAQLDLNEIKLDIFQSLSGKTLKVDDKGIATWKEPDNNRLRILSDYGIQKVMEIVHFHITKNTLLSNYSEDQIKQIMLRVTTALNDFLLMSYENFFYIPTFKECQTIFEEEMKEKEEIRAFVKEQVGQVVDKEEIKKEVLKEIEEKIEEKIHLIRDGEQKRRLKEYELICINVEDQILNTYNRAFRGEERGSLRRHSSFSEISTPPTMMSPQQKRGLFKWGSR